MKILDWKCFMCFCTKAARIAYCVKLCSFLRFWFIWSSWSLIILVLFPQVVPSAPVVGETDYSDPVWRQAGPAAQTRLGAERRRSLQQLHGAVWGPAIHKRYSSSPLDLLQYQREHLFSHCYSSRFILWSGLCYVVLWCMLFEAWQFQSLFTFIILICNVI